MNNSLKEFRTLAFGSPVGARPVAPPLGDRTDARMRRVRAAPSGAGRPLRAFPRLLGLFAMLVLVPGALLGARAQIVDAWSPAAEIYKLVGLPVNLRGLEILGVQSRLHEESGRTLLIVEGEIANVSGRRIPVPQIRLSLRTHDRREVYAWSEASPRGELEAAERIFFRTRLVSPPRNSREVLVQFQTPEPMSPVQFSYRAGETQ